MFNLTRGMYRDTSNEGSPSGEPAPTAGNLADALDAQPEPTPGEEPTPKGGVPTSPPAPKTPEKPGEFPVTLGADFNIENVPEKFVKDGKVDVEGVLGAFTELEKGQSTNDGFIGEVPETYVFTHPKIEGVDDDRIKKSIDGNDPIVKSFQDFAKGKNFTQKAHDELMGWFVDASMKAQASQIAGEMEALGEKGAELVTINSKFFKANLSEDGFKGVREAMVSANAVKALNEIRLAMGDTVVPNEGGDVPGSLTEQSLKDKMKLAAYWDPDHADYNTLRDEVEQGYKKLFKESGT